MIVDLRINTCQPNRMAEFVKLYETEAWPLQKKYLQRCLGWVHHGGGTAEPRGPPVGL